MAVVRLDLFTGEKPARHPDKLGQSDAQVARNTRLLSGALDVWRGLEPLMSSNLLASATIFRTQYGRWLEWSERVAPANTIVPNDQWERVYFTRDAGDGGVRAADRDSATSGTQPHLVAHYPVGTPSPTGVTWEKVEPEGDDEEGDDDGGTEFERTYFYTVTFVNDWGEEGPPLSEPVGPIEIFPWEAVKLNLPSIPSGYEGRPINECRIYRSSGGEYLFLAQVGLSNEEEGEFGAWIDDVEWPQEPLPSQDWEPPPDGLRGLTVVGGNYFVAYRRNEILCSETGLPHAWPIDYRQPIDYEIKALASFGSTLVALTTGTVYMGQGSHPSAIAMTDTTFQAPCASEDSVVAMAGGVMYATPDGLCFVTAQGPRFVTDGLFTRDEWQQYNPSSMKAGTWGQLYIVFYQSGQKGEGAMVFDPARAAEWGVSFLDVDYPSAVFAHQEEGRLYIVEDSAIQEWHAESSPAVPYRWRSRPLTLSRPSPLNVVRVWADDYPVIARIYRDGTLQAEVSVESERPRRVAGGALGREYAIEIEGNTPVYSLAMATTMAEVQQA